MSLRSCQENLTRNRGRTRKIKAHKANSYIQSRTFSWAPAVCPVPLSPREGGRREQASPAVRSRPHTLSNLQRRVSDGESAHRVWSRHTGFDSYYVSMWVFSSCNSLFVSRSSWNPVPLRSCRELGEWRAGLQPPLHFLTAEYPLASHFICQSPECQLIHLQNVENNSCSAPSPRSCEGQTQ